ncbi:DNA-directed RNA polymerase sigma-70 factor [Haloferula helveola]|uniref:DNA-directed RNA polymerase sigma-70 factor n=1 Tax=Haloferula helveola TaxID=490095 RepID=A0ABN6H1J4_9BACT|nr:DNA-directed RNA polymerase sigma-70 factor [Haloferula helveola]
MLQLHAIDDDPGDVQFVQLLTEHQNIIRSFIISLLPGAPGVDDVIQNTNAVLWRKRADFTHGTNFRAWAFSIARFQTMAYLKQLKRRRWVTLDPDVAIKIADDIEARPETPEDQECRLEALDDCLGKLRPKDRELLVQRYWHRTRLQDFAVTSQRSVQALKVTLFRLRAGLKRCIEESVADPSKPSAS